MCSAVRTIGTSMTKSSKAAKAVREFVSGRDRVLAYGSSMGGYAAIRFGSLFGATLAAAFSPQYSIDPSVAPFETRWSGDAARIDFRIERRAVPFTPKSYVFYDPRDTDRLHVDLFRSGTELIDVPVPIGGHPCTTILADTKILRLLILSLLETGEIADFQSVYRAARRRSSQFFFNLSVAARRPRARALLAERAYRLNDSPIYASHYGQMLAQEGRLDEARPLMRWALEREPDNLVIKYRQSEVLEAEGDLANALQTIDGIFALSNDVRAFWPRREQLSKRLSELWGSRFGEAFSRDLGGGDQNTNKGAEEVKRRRRLFALFRGESTSNRDKPGPAIQRPDEIAVPLGVEADVLLATIPAPPQFAVSWRKHLNLLKLVSDEPLDLILAGDSLADWWPPRLWEGLRVLNLGVAGDRTQHLIWRLLQLPNGVLRARCALIVIGTNNLGSGDSAQAIVAGVERVLKVLRRKAHIDRIVAFEVPPVGVDFSWRAEERLRAHAGLRALGVETLNADERLIAGARERSPNYAEDGVHFSDAGYETLTALVRDRLFSNPD